MGKATGFLEYERETGRGAAPKERIKNWNEFHTPLSEQEQRRQGARCMDCGVPFCQSGMMICRMVSGCPVHNLVPEWNDLVYNGNWKQENQQLPGVHLQGMPCALRGGLYLQPVRGCGNCPGKREGHH